MAIKIKITSTFRFNKAIAKKFCKVKYYEAQAKNQRKAEYIDAEKVRLSTPRWEKITELIEGYKSQAVTTKSSTGKVLLGIYKKNCGAAKNNITIQNIHRRLKKSC